MCGITGVIHEEREKKEAIKEMTSLIAHRGPDDAGFFSDDFVALGMRRLSIIDIDGGHQPIFSDDGKKCIVFNGEIYNYKELKASLEREGHNFKTLSDTEVVLKMYEVFGEEVPKRLRGMFAFAIYDRERKEIFLARDFFGIKPLYYLLATSPDTSLEKSSDVSSKALPDFSHEVSDSVLAFSSEMKSFLAYPGFKPEVNDSAVFNYLSYQYNPLDETFLKRIYKLSPGYYMRINVSNGEFEIKRYWHFDFAPSGADKEETKKKILETMKDSVSHHMIADVPVGSFLSGGIDSSIIATLMSQRLEHMQESGSRPQASGHKVKTFTVAFGDVSEGVEARETAEPLGTEHHEVKVGKREYFEVLEEAAWHFDEPVADPSAIGLYFLAREARKHVKVVLSGEGSDELFGGYNIYLEPFARRWISWLPRPLLKLIVSIPFEFKGKNFARRALIPLRDRYIGNAKVFENEEIKNLWKNSPEEQYSLDNLFDNVSELSDSTKMQYIDIHTWLVGDILAKADKMTMAHSLELRVPFLDLKVAELARTLPDRFKWRRGETKHLLREAFRNILPESTRKRPKLGFPTSVKSWLREDGEIVERIILDNKYIKSRMNPSLIETLIRDHTSGKRDNTRKIYLLLMLSLWYNRFILKK